MPLSFVTYTPLTPPTYHASAFPVSTWIWFTPASFIGRITGPQLNPAICCGGIAPSREVDGRAADADTAPPGMITDRISWRMGHHYTPGRCVDTFRVAI